MKMQDDNGQWTNVQTPPCLMCGKTSIVQVPFEAFEELVSPGGRHIQDILPDWPADQRELLLTGTHPGCWDQMLLPEDGGDGIRSS